jgi:hypothetical protein
MTNVSEKVIQFFLRRTEEINFPEQSFLSMNVSLLSTWRLVLHINKKYKFGNIIEFIIFISLNSVIKTLRSFNYMQLLGWTPLFRTCNIYTIN